MSLGNNSGFYLKKKKKNVSKSELNFWARTNYFVNQATENKASAGSNQDIFADFKRAAPVCTYLGSVVLYFQL